MKAKRMVGVLTVGLMLVAHTAARADAEVAGYLNWWNLPLSTTMVGEGQCQGGSSSDDDYFYGGTTMSIYCTLLDQDSQTVDADAKEGLSTQNSNHDVVELDEQVTVTQSGGTIQVQAWIVIYQLDEDDHTFSCNVGTWGGEAKYGCVP